MRTCLLLLVSLCLAGCASVAPRTPSQALPPGDSALAQTVRAQAESRPAGHSGFRLLSPSDEAFIARAELIRAAEHSLDLQYYIVQDGFTTRALVDELLRAADRGVRVRILLDDTTSAGRDYQLALLGAHPQIQLRVFNPLHLGRSTGLTRSLGRLFNLSQQHRRMHNKLWLADSSVAIVGGRNLGDEYFDAEPELNFTDIDLLSAGPVAEQLAHSFDQYWNSALSKPIEQFTWRTPTAEQLRQRRSALHEDVQRTRRSDPQRFEPLMSYTHSPRLQGWLGELIWAPSQALWDAPSKVLAEGLPDPELLLTTQLAPALAAVDDELMLVSAYFVPADEGLDYLTGRADAGVSISLLTNSLEATDVPAVHGGYAPYRRALLKHGVRLYELRRQPYEERTYNLSGSSESSLHSKTAILDRQKVFIGSLNFDPRSVLWNTEVGVLVDSRALAEQVRDLTLEGMAPTISYEVRLESPESGAPLVWLAADSDGNLYRLRQEPGGFWRHLNAWFARAIGLESML
ncbi:phospholipase D family protein [Pseudomonas borbori]